MDQRRAPRPQISTRMVRFRAGAKTASVCQSGSGNKSTTKFQGNPSGTKKTPANGPDGLPKRPKVPMMKSPTANAYRIEKPMTMRRQARCICMLMVSPAAA